MTKRELADSLAFFEGAVRKKTWIQNGRDNSCRELSNAEKPSLCKQTADETHITAYSIARPAIHRHEIANLP